MQAADRARTGIEGLDELLRGGIPRGQLLLLTGTAGTGKTILGSQFISAGVRTYQEAGVYLSFEEPADFLKENMKNIGVDFAALERSGKFAFMKYDPYRVEDIHEILESTIREIGASRVVIDSVSALGLHIRDRAELRAMIFNLALTLRRLGCTSIMTSEIVQGSGQKLSRYGVEEFVADSVVVLYYERLQGTFNRGIQVWKLRGSPHSEKVHPYAITDQGIAVNPLDEMFVKG